MKYLVFRVCERFGQTAEWFYNLDLETQLDYLAYDSIRGEEEAILAAASAGAKIIR